MVKPFNSNMKRAIRTASQLVMLMHPIMYMFFCQKCFILTYKGQGTIKHFCFQSSSIISSNKVYFVLVLSSPLRILKSIHIYRCPRRKGPNFGRVFLRSNYTDITQNTYIQSSMVTEILAREI